KTAITQLQMSYSAEEDRILLRLNSSAEEEFRFWITRRFALILHQALQAHRQADPDVAIQPTPDAQQAVQEFKQQAAQSRGNFKEEFKPSAKLPLGDAPLLAFKLSYRIEGGKLHLSMQPKTGRGISLVLDSQLNFNVTRLLRSASEAGKWGLDWGSTADLVPEKRVIN
ncbi:MAG: hypothetical protein O3B72_08160, partial [Proteobacteria bacterium]|nr:hypothetical protein [Pseudomonadota bacterium]